jgi:hypothetical protein
MCIKPSGSFTEFNNLGSWSVCNDCKKPIINSFEFFRDDNEEEQQKLANAVMD